MKTLGIIAGNGSFPLLVAAQARKQGMKTAVCALEKEAKPEIEKLADHFLWVKIGQLKKVSDFFKKSGVDEAVMAGKVEKVRLFQENVQPDFEMVKVLMKTRDFKDDSLLLGVVQYLESQGIPIADSTSLIRDQMPGSGVLGKHKPSHEMMDDVRFGFKMAKAVAGLDIGQTVVVKKKAVLAVEAIEGTDETIRRGGRAGAGKVTVVKVAKPNQDMRFDVPAAGLQTLESLREAGAQVFAFEAGKTIFMDQAMFIAEADKQKMVVIGVNEDFLGAS